MDYLVILSFIPKLTLLALLIIGVAIFVEVFYLAKQRRKQEKKEIPSELKQKTEVLKFPQGEGQKESPSPSSSRKKLLSLTLISGLILGLVSTLIVVEQRQEIRKKAEEPAAVEEPAITPTGLLENTPAVTLSLTSLPESSPTASLTEEASPKAPEIKVYQLKENQWLRLEEKELALLTVGEEIKIAASSSADFAGAIFKINGKTAEPAPSTRKNPFGEFYVDYIIPEKMSNFLLEVELVKELE